MVKSRRSVFHPLPTTLVTELFLPVSPTLAARLDKAQALHLRLHQTNQARPGARSPGRSRPAQRQPRQHGLLRPPASPWQNARLRRSSARARGTTCSATLPPTSPTTSIRPWSCSSTTIRTCIPCCATPFALGAPGQQKGPSRGRYRAHPGGGRHTTAETETAPVACATGAALCQAFNALFRRISSSSAKTIARRCYFRMMPVAASKAYPWLSRYWYSKCV